MKSVVLFPALLLVAAAGAAASTSEPSSAPASAPAPLAGEALQTLQLLQDRKATLKDFTANVDYSVENKAGDLDGKLGTLNYTDDGATTKFIFDFTRDTFGGTPTHMHHTQLVADGTYVTLIDYAAKQFNRSASPGPTNSLKSPIPLPIGIKVDEVNDNFTVAVLPASKDPNVVTLRLIPRLKGRFDYTQLDLTVDKKLAIPVKVIVHGTAKGEITTVKLLKPEINTGKATVPAVAIPTDKDWTVDLGAAVAAPATGPGK